MAVGNQATVAGLNATLTQYATQMRNLAFQIANLNKQVAALGVAGLEDPVRCSPGYASAANPSNPGGVSDAQAVVNLAAQLNNVAAVYYGTLGTAAAGQPAVALDYDTALATLWGGQ